MRIQGPFLQRAIQAILDTHLEELYTIILKAETIIIAFPA